MRQASVQGPATKMKGHVSSSISFQSSRECWRAQMDTKHATIWSSSALASLLILEMDKFGWPGMMWASLNSKKEEPRSANNEIISFYVATAALMMTSSIKFFGMLPYISMESQWCQALRRSNGRAKKRAQHSCHFPISLRFVAGEYDMCCLLLGLALLQPTIWLLIFRLSM